MNEPKYQQLSETASPQRSSETVSPQHFAELELRWQDARAQRQRAAQLFHSDEWDVLPDEEWDD
jgi:hypothetical protein